MIVRSVEEGWRVVFHAAHGLLAQDLASHVDIGDQLPYWPLTQVAIGNHDDAKQQFRPGKRTYVTDVGVPKDFTLMSMSSEERVKDARSQIWEACKKHRWIGLLVSLHNDSLYRNEPVADEMQSLLDDERKRRSEVLNDLEVTSDDLQASYDWMSWCDRCSLILSGKDVPAMQRRVEIITTSQGQRYDLQQDKSGILHIEPWPFRERDFKVSIEARTLRQLSYQDDAELADALRHSSVHDEIFSFQSADNTKII